MIKKLFAGFLGAVVLISCVAAVAAPKPREITLAAFSLGTPDSLAVVAEWAASTVPVKNGEIVYPVRWRVNGVDKLVDTVTDLADTLRFARAGVGLTDTVEFSLRALYLVNGRTSNEAVAIREFTNADLQVPSVPVLISVDTLP